ncbi:MAG TPA: RlpA-like double-psi beta-barrel domain-containing protein [Coriobacteriia bacterium]
MHRDTLRLLSLALVLALGAPSHAFAAPSSGTVADKQAEAARAQREMRRMQSELSAGMTDLGRVTGQLERTRREIDANTKRLRSLEATLKDIETRLGARADYMYRTRDSGPLDLLFGATSFDEFLQRFDMLSRIAQDDAGLIGRGKSARIEARRLRAGLKARETQLVALRDRSAAQRDRLAGSLSQQRAYFGSLSADVAAILASAEKASRPAAPSAGSALPPKPRAGLAVATVAGRNGGYYVMADEPRAYRATGVGMNTQASIYSVADNGTGTSSGVPLDDNVLTCAHKTLGFGTHVAITHGNRRIICVVTDRGPFAPPGRDLDLTPRAASLLGIDGVGNVHYEVVEPTR